MTCDHVPICLTSSNFSSVVGYKRSSAQALFTAAIGSRKRHLTDLKLERACPPPLVLPGDDLAEDPKYPPQSFNSWLKAPERNAITPERRTIYVAASPVIPSRVGFMRTWLTPRAIETSEMVAVPSASDVCGYLKAFYHGLTVKVLPSRPRYVAWSENASCEKKNHLPRPLKSIDTPYVGLKVASNVTHIRTRYLPGASGRLMSAYAHQLNLDDILDCAMSALPEDAYALIVLVDHDIYEDDDDDFCCGRAYGGSQIAVVSSAQYNPSLDQLHHIDRAHCWPASHCMSFLEEKTKAGIKSQQIRGSSSKIEPLPSFQAGSGRDTSRFRTENAMLPSKDPTKDAVSGGAMEAALQVYRHRQVNTTIQDERALQSMYLLRLARTASHELGHCLGMDHCTYYACAMQGTASTKEDSRQPPYLCPVCLNKLAHAAVELNSPRKVIDKEQAVQYKRTWLRDRHQKIRDYCRRQEDSGFAALAAWTDSLLDDDPLQAILCN